MAGGMETGRKGVRVLALMPSVGLGGGIEAYFAALKEALSDLGADVETRALQTPERPRPTVLTKARFALEAVAAARHLAREEDVLLFVLHPGLLPVGVVAQGMARLPSLRCSLFFYGADIWGHSRIRRRFPQRAGWRVMTISSFSAGALVESGPVTVLPPGIPRERYRRLVADVPSDEVPSREIDVLTVIRLGDAEVKGAWALLGAADIVRGGRSDFSLVIAGSGHAPPDLRAAVTERRAWVELRENVAFEELADLYRQAKIFVLATRSHLPGQKGFRGEGFGIVLVEAQLAGTPVIAPCLGGSSDAYLHGVTGLRPADESPEALAATIERLLTNDDVLQSMATRATRWARHAFSPSAYNESVGRLLLHYQGGERYQGHEITAPPRRATTG